MQCEAVRWDCDYESYQDSYVWFNIYYDSSLKDGIPSVLRRRYHSLNWTKLSLWPSGASSREEKKVSSKEVTISRIRQGIRAH